MELVRRSFEELYPSKLFNYDVEVHYSGQFKAYNARVQLRGRALTFRLSKEWRTVDSDIVQGLYQSLFLKMFGGKDTFHTNLYTSFLKKVPMFTERGESEVFLVESFGDRRHGQRPVLLFDRFGQCLDYPCALSSHQHVRPRSQRL